MTMTAVRMKILDRLVLVQNLIGPRSEEILVIVTDYSNILNSSAKLPPLLVTKGSSSQPTVSCLPCSVEMLIT